MAEALFVIDHAAKQTGTNIALLKCELLNMVSSLKSKSKMKA
jgi:hypothetical protein